MTRSLSPFGTLITLMGLNIAAGIANWVLDPAHWPHWLAGIVTPPVLFSIVYACAASKSGRSRNVTISAGTRLELTSAAGLILFAMTAMTLQKSGVLNDDFMTRVVGISLAVALVFFGNRQPKGLQLLSDKGRAYRLQLVNRWSGWALFVAGSATLFVWFVSSVQSANSFAMLATVCVLVLIAVFRIVIFRLWFQPTKTLSSAVTQARWEKVTGR